MSCNIAQIPLHGTLYRSASTIDPETNDYASASSELIVDAIERADEDSGIDAIVLDVDSYGGLVVAGEEIANALKRTYKPTVALIHESGDSAAYWAATGAEVIFASENSDVGGIGVTASYSDAVQKNNKEGYTFNQIASAKFKDMGNPDMPLTREGRELIQQQVNVIHQNFVSQVSVNRDLDRAEVATLANGASLLGAEALKVGLIDQIGDASSVISYFESIGIENPDMCRYE